jgi:predicted lipoprotein
MEEMAAVFAEAAPGPRRLDAGAMFASARRAIAAMPDDVGAAAADPERRDAVARAYFALAFVKDLLVQTMAPALGVTLGFNALDGD